MLFFQRNWSPLFFISDSTSFFVIHVNVDRTGPFSVPDTFCICSVMASFKEFRQTLLFYYDVDLITVEHLALWPFLSSKNCFKKAETVLKLN